MTRALLAPLALALLHCGSVVQPDVSAMDAMAEESTPTEADSADVVEDREDARALDAADVRFVEAATDADANPDATDVVRDAGLVRSCATPEPPPGMELPGTNRSCDPDGGAPAEHCREVWQCGGTVNIYETPAYYYSEGGAGFSPITRATPSCGSPRNISVHAGYVDAYEVSVARFRAWVRAGRPGPNNERMFPGTTTVTADQRSLDRAQFDRESGSLVAQPEVCTYRDTPGENDHLPVNCVERDIALVFCWWEGKHLVTDAAWVYVAGNSEWRTEYPFSLAGVGANLCEIGDIGRGTVCRGRTGLPDPIDHYPRGVSLNPPGIFNLFGGMAELTFGAGVPFSAMDFSSAFCTLPFSETNGRFPPARGSSAFNSERSLGVLTGVMHRTSSGAVDSATRWTGFRCSRWVPELR
jgi:hypothetical protein